MDEKTAPARCRFLYEKEMPLFNANQRLVAHGSLVCARSHGCVCLECLGHDAVAVLRFPVTTGGSIAIYTAIPRRLSPPTTR